ncbi:MAG: MmgE/PrpD family protein [Betaproteobacteria bacterium]|nr:MmgE/PrpD family protein [Betaproteobacteria bacterium]
MGVTEKIARFIVETDYDRIPPKAIDLSKRSILDCAGLCLAGGAMPAGALAVQYIRELGGVPEAVVIGKKFRAPAPHAALTNGTMISSLNWADSSFVGHLWHPTPTLFSAILALADKYRISGKQMIEAHVVGFEAGSRIAAGWLQHYELGWLTTSTVGTLACAAAAAKVLDLDVHQTRMALGIACDNVSGTKQTMGAMHALSAGKAARDGVVAASLAKIGYTGDANGLEGPESISALMTWGKFDLDKMGAGLGKDYYMTLPGGLSLKFYPCGHLSHWCIDATLLLARENDIKADDVAEVICEMPAAFIETLRYHHPKTALEAKISVEYPVTAALLDREAGAQVFTDEKVIRPEAQDLIGRVKCIPRAGNPGFAGTGEEPNTVTIKLKNGASYAKTVSFPKGDIRNPLTDAELSGKFQECASDVLTTKQAQQALDILWKLDSQSQLSNLTSILMA